FDDVVADADDLGRAAAEANRSARRTYANVPSPSPEFDRLEPDMENRGADPSRDAPFGLEQPPPMGPRSTPPPMLPRSEPRSKTKSRAQTVKRPKAAAKFPLTGAIVLGLALVLLGLA